MVRRHPLPACWLMSDARSAAGTVALAALIPPGSGIVLRHDALPQRARWRLARRLARIANARGLMLLIAGPPAEARRWGADGVHLRQHAARRAAQARAIGLIVTMPVHDRREARRARQAGADAAFVSPLHPTRSHPGAAPLGRTQWLRLARAAGGRAIALGGMTPAHARALTRASAASGLAPGWAAIDAWEAKAATRKARRALAR
ncbi:thiamine phosphate synthase [Sphingopyxis terrae]|uniref:thiamine phosphate synthase n=1 Tax=Sphingopyxis terrae TaxID=33052 RepID=UPI002A160BAF|nr:thiamine phosphate synthase [Sphingopyxis terrae]MDX8356355.1 thiamine phosphate synthase [Sphingopyxis terrae]